MFRLAAAVVATAALSISPFTFAAPLGGHYGLNVQLSVGEGLLDNSTDGRILVLLAPAGVDPLEDTDVTSSPDYFFGKNAFEYSSGDLAVLSGGSGKQPMTDVWGFPNVSMNDVPAGDYTAQAFLNIYDTVTRSDGSVVSVRFPCGDGATPINGPGSLSTAQQNVTVKGGSQSIELAFTNVTAAIDFNGTEIGSCHQGNYEDTEFLKYVKIRSSVLSDFWARDMYVGATVLLPHGYTANDTSVRYPVLYHQGHWPGGAGPYSYDDDEDFTGAWNAGAIPGTNITAERETPKLIIVQFRHETPYYDDSYAVNTANIGPYGEAINDELIPHLEETFNTIASPHARIQDGGSTGGWESIASVIFRPDLFGACFSSYPDSLDFHKHQDIPLYDAANAYTRPDGSKIQSIRSVVNGSLVDVASVEQENNWELAHGTSSRSFLQWDVWQAVFGAQGLNGYPLEAWDKVTGEIFPEAVEYWKEFDLSHYLTSHWEDEKKLGAALEGRINVYVGSYDNYFLNEGVQEFRKRVTAKGGDDWANITILEGETHGGNYLLLDTWEYLELVLGWVADHAPDGETPLAESATAASTRGNEWEEVIALGGHQAALDRQAPPSIENAEGSVEGSVGRWDPGVELEAQWVVDKKPKGRPFEVFQGDKVKYASKSKRACHLQLSVTGRKRGYADETRVSEAVDATE